MALESTPKLLLLDEPTTALDPKTRLLILDLLRELQKGRRLETNPVDTRKGSFYLSWKYFKNNEIKARFRVIE